MATLTGNIDADDTEIPVSDDTVAGFYTVGSEAIQLLGVVDPLVPGFGDGPTGKRHAIRAIGGTTAATHSSGATLTRYYPDAASAAGGLSNPVTEPLVIEPTADTSPPLQIVPPATLPDDDFVLNVQDKTGADAFTVTGDGQIQIIPTEVTGAGTSLLLVSDHRSKDDYAVIVEAQGGSANGSIIVVDTAGDLLLRLQQADAALVIFQPVAADRPFEVVGNAFSTKRFAVDGAGRYRTFAVTAPADADVATSEMVVWFDNTNGAAKLMIKGKTADGTVVTGNVPLT